MPYILTNWFKVSNEAPTGQIPDSVAFSFYLGAIAFFGAVLWTVLKTKEYPPEDLTEFENKKKENLGFAKGTKEIFDSLIKMPKTMITLAVVQFFTWFALFCMWIYTTPAVTHHIYKATDPKSVEYNTGANWVGVLFASYSAFAALFAFLIPVIANKTSRKITHAISLVAGGLGLISFYFITNPDLLIISEIGIGLAWASILSMPYAILAGALPKERMGVYMGIFNFFIVIPQIIAAAILGFFVKNFFGGEAIYALLLGGISLFIAAIMVALVNDVDEVKVAK